jgi:hypothetical protein
VSEYDKPLLARLSFGDKVLDAESPMVIWHVPSWPGMAAHLTQPPLASVPVPPGSGVPEGPVLPPPERYVAVCDLQHPSDLPGTNPDGTWFGGAFDNRRDACGVVAVHDDGFAHVALDLGTYLVAVQCD